MNRLFIDSVYALFGIMRQILAHRKVWAPLRTQKLPFMYSTRS